MLGEQVDWRKQRRFTFQETEKLEKKNPNKKTKARRTVRGGRRAEKRGKPCDRPAGGALKPSEVHYVGLGGVSMHDAAQRTDRAEESPPRSSRSSPAQSGCTARNCRERREREEGGETVLVRERARECVCVCLALSCFVRGKGRESDSCR